MHIPHFAKTMTEDKERELKDLVTVILMSTSELEPEVKKEVRQAVADLMKLFKL